ncbi:ATP-binding protein [Actinomycetospora flava]|uniref:AAA family ATPase n=1 Tax=Actinomycetospora flava TaxID=3129232 RepID=A0ABU8M8S6_9PSEU
MGRRAEREAVDHLLAGARDGRSGVLVVRGEAGIGKSALLEHARDAAGRAGFRVERAAGAESETQFAFAGLHQLCGLLMDRVDALPAPQQAALGVAFGLRDGDAPDRFLVGLAVLTLLAEVAEDAPVLCLLDDAQWLDRASAEVLAFVARRVVAERVALVFALRDTDGPGTDPFTGLPVLRPAALGVTEARALLAAGWPAPVDAGVRDRIVGEARGNPLALLELPRAAEGARLAGGFERPDVLGVPRRVEEEFRLRSASLPAATQLLVLVAAADPTGETALLRRAAGHLGVDDDAAAPAEAAGLVEIDARVRFRHPLVRSAVYRAATPTDRRRAHAALAAATDPRSDPDRRAWHRARAVLGTDEEAAAELELSAGRARARGGVAAAAAFLQHAAELTPDPARRAARALEAADAQHEAGASAEALELLAVAADGPLDALSLARLELLRARIALHLSPGGEVPGMLLDAAKALAPLDAALSRETYLHAIDAASVTGGGHDRSVREIAAAARAAPPAPGRPRAADLLLDGLVTTFTRGFAAGAPGLRRALEAIRNGGRGDGGRADHRWLLLGMRTATALYDDETADVLAARNVRLAREAGALSTLPAALIARSAALVLTGRLAQGAADLDAEGAALMRATGAEPTRYAQLALAGWRGREADTAELTAAGAEDAGGRGAGAEATFAQYALAVLHNGLGDYPSALQAAARASASDDPPTSSLALPELVEAAVRAGAPERAAAALEELTSRAAASGTPWALGLAARSRALTSTGPEADGHYREAIDRLGESRMATHLARTHLVYGEWLRREGSRQAARDQLRTAHEQLTAMGAEAFGERAARELRATGEHPRKRTERPSDALTAQERQIARLVATGATSQEVAAQLFLSPRTIETHLRNIFRKLGITSRRRLRDLPLD